MIDNACEWGTSTFLIFSENVGQLVYYTHMFPLLISLFVGIIVFINNPRALVNRVFFFMTLMFSVWVYFDLILWASPTPEAVMFFWASIVPVEMLMYLSGLYLVYLFSTDKHDAPVWLKATVGLTMLPIILLMHTNLNVVGLSPDCDEGAIEGPLIQYMYITEIVIIFAIAFLIFHGHRSLASLVQRKKLMSIGIATFLFLLFFSAGNMTLLFSMGPFYEQYKLFGMPIFAAVVAYSFIKYRTFGVKILFTEVLVAALIMILFSTILLENMQIARPLLAVTLLVSAVLGLQLVLSVRKEVEQRKHIEELAQNLEAANERLKVLDKMKSEFVSIASHQLRSPLTAIRGYASMLLEGSYGKIPKKAEDAIKRIADSSRHMSHSVEDYLNVSRIEAGNMKYEISDFNLKDITEGIVDEMRNAAADQELTLVFKSECPTDCLVRADIGKTRQVIQNLIDNAMKYTKAGTITVTVKDDSAAKKLHITVADTGVGMSEETQKEVFNKFIRAKNANEVNVTGTGLGLFVAKKMTEEMGGRIWAESEGEGKGSTFHVELPLTPEESKKTS